MPRFSCVMPALGGGGSSALPLPFLLLFLLARVFLGLPPFMFLADDSRAGWSWAYGMAWTRWRRELGRAVTICIVNVTCTGNHVLYWPTGRGGGSD